MKEKWKTIKGFPDYEISTKGRIKSFKRYKEGKLMNPAVDGRGYRSVDLYIAGFYKKIKIHYLVLSSFTKKMTGPCCNHKDGDKLNNNIKNLEWVSHRENVHHALSLGLGGGKRIYQIRLRESDIKAIRILIHWGINKGFVADMFLMGYDAILSIYKRETWGYVI